MGYVRHTAIIVTSYDYDTAVAAALIIKTLGNAERQALHMSNLIPPIVNDYWTLLVAPEGSKLGWPEADKAAEARDRVIAWLREQDGLSWVEVHYGSDDNNAWIGRHAYDQQHPEERTEEP